MLTHSILLSIVIILVVLCKSVAECPNACSSHGKCGSYDMCTCYRNWMGNDCSQRICQFGRAHVDIPKGDLDSSGSVTPPTTLTVVNSQLYPQGTSELFPDMTDTDENILTNTAHEYSECSNKGYCARDTGECECAIGYDGSACQRVSCPSRDYGTICSGHGTCESAKYFAKMDNDNVYRLWDEDTTMGCKCDPGWTGVDCTQRSCKIGKDPIFKDIDSSHRYSNWSVVFYTASSTATIIGNFSFKFTDHYGETWETAPLQYGSTCLEVTTAFESLPNNVIPLNSVSCLRWTNYQSISKADEPIWSTVFPYYGMKYTIAFPSNPGKLPPISINTYLDGYRSTIYSSEPASPMKSFIYANGFLGQMDEYFPTKCAGVDVTILQQSSSSARLTYQYLGGFTNLEFRLFQKCLGSSNTNAPPQIPGRVKGQLYYWDYGTVYNPHLVRLVDMTRGGHVTDLCPGAMNSDRGRGVTCSITNAPGFIVPLYFEPSSNRFILMTRPKEDYSSSTLFAIWTTDGSTMMISNGTKLYTDPSNPYSTTVYSVNSTRKHSGFTGDISCESSKVNFNEAFSCIEKGNLVFFLDMEFFSFNPKYMNLYTVNKIYTFDANANYYDSAVGPHRIVLDSAITSAWNQYDPISVIRAFSFTPVTSYPLVSECSNRGLCDTLTGLCSCFFGYSLDDCSKLDNTVHL